MIRIMKKSYISFKILKKFEKIIKKILNIYKKLNSSFLKKKIVAVLSI